MSSETIQNIPLAKILIDPQFNLRSGNWMADLNELEASIEAKGQDVPCIVTPTPEGLFFLVSGAGRCEAIRRISERTGRPAVVSCVVRDLPQAERYALNIRENAARNAVKPADNAFALWRLKQQLESEGKSALSSDLARGTGMSEERTRDLYQIMRRVHPKVTEAWRTAPVLVSIEDMLRLSRLPKDAQEQAYRNLLRNPGGRDRAAKRQVSDPTARKLQGYGELLGRLYRAGAIDRSVDFDVHIEQFVKLPMHVSHSRRQALVELAQQAFEKGFTCQKNTEVL